MGFHLPSTFVLVPNIGWLGRSGTKGQFKIKIVSVPPQCHIKPMTTLLAGKYASHNAGVDSHQLAVAERLGSIQGTKVTGIDSKHKAGNCTKVNDF